MITGKTIIVIGASGGIGRVLVRDFAQAGAHVTLSARTESKLDEVKEDLGLDDALIVAGDASNPEDVMRVFAQAKQEFGSVDAVVIAAGTWDRLSVDDTVTDAVALANKHYQSLFMPTFVVGEVAQQFFRKQGHGLIVNISSHAALRPELAHNLTYGPMKSAAHHFMMALRHDPVLAQTNVRVTDIAPAIVNTPEAVGLLDTEEKRAQAVQPEAIAKWIIENFENADIPDTQLFDSTLVL